MTNIFIPTKIKVGFQKREGTFTGKLGYVIYYDEKGKVRKETSWDGWRDHKIEAVEFENKPQSGYIFNKGVQRGGYNWGSGRSSIRVYDPRDFEFEISVDNLIGILMHSDVSKRDIVEECVFAWEGKELVLLPVNSEEYQASVKYTAKLSEKVSARDLVKGYTYNQKRSEEVLTYLGYYDWFDWTYANEQTVHRCVGKKHVFYNPQSKDFITPSMGTLSSVNCEEVVSDYARLVDKFFKTLNSQAIVAIKIEKTKNKNINYLNRMTNGVVERIYHYYRQNDEPFRDVDYHWSGQTYSFGNKQVVTKKVQHDNSRYYSYYNRTPGPIEKALLEKAKQLGFDPKKLTKNQCYEILEAEGFGQVVLVLENGSNIIDEARYY